MIIVFVEEITERLIYVFDFVFKDRGVKFQLTNDPLFFDLNEGDKFSYSLRKFEGVPQLIPADILFTESIKEYQLSKGFFFDEECLVLDHLCDPFAAIFYVLSRYEEYIILKRDNHDRFVPTNSIQFEYKWLDKCVCDRWCVAIFLFLEDYFVKPIDSYRIESKLIPTFDIDHVRAFEWKEGIRTLYGQARDFIEKKYTQKKRRSNVLAKIEKDPYDTFDFIQSFVNDGLDVKVFWLVGDFAKNDKNISAYDERHRALILEMSNQLDVGIHPSYKSNDSTYFLEKEILRLNEITGHKIIISRQHYLKLELPLTYRNLISYGIKDDYSMGYAQEPGFRAGTARPFYFFDLKKNTKTNLKLHPFSYMDITYRKYKKMSVIQAKDSVQQLANEVKQFGGQFIPVWHNESISEYEEWVGWSELLYFTKQQFLF